MDYILMHKNISVMEIVVDDLTGNIRKTGKIFNYKHIPIGVTARKGIIDRTLLNEWWTDRSIPIQRSGVRETLKIMNISNTMILVQKYFGLSLSDQYWIRPKNCDNIEWKNINFFDNRFSQDVGNILLGKAINKENIQFNSPDNTCDGFLKKRWITLNNKNFLIKSGSEPFNQQPFNEKIASLIMKELNITHTEYDIIKENGISYSICENFVTSETEFVTAWRIMHINKKSNNISIYQHYVNCCKELGVNNIINSLNQMIVIDYLIANEDRHLSNFGLIRNADNLNWCGVVPIFDSGSSFGYNKFEGQLLSGKNIICKPFKKNHIEQLKLVTNFDFINFDKLIKTQKYVSDILSDGVDCINEKRIRNIVKSYSKRIEYLQSISCEKNKFEDNRTLDVTKNKAETYE